MSFTERSDVLDPLRALIGDADHPERWTQKAMARNGRTNRPVKTDSPRATCWCVMGAIDYCYPTYGDDRTEAVKRLLRALNHASIGWWNDSPDRTHADVCKLLERA